MNTKNLTKRNSFTTNMLIVAAIAVAGIAGYLMLTKSGSGSGTNNTGGGNTNNTGGGNTNSGGGKQTSLPPDPAPSTFCQATSSEFPLAQGAGYFGRANQACEQQYVKVVQRYLNGYTALGFSTLTVDGQLGPKTMAAYKIRFDSWLATYNDISRSSYLNIVKELGG